MTDIRYPIGKFQAPASVTDEDRRTLVAQVEDAPRALRDAVGGLAAAQLDTPYREGGWTVRQVVHHVADSHMNAYIRFKLAITRDQPTINAYDENQWAKLSDGAGGDVEWSLALIDGLHRRWTTFLRSLEPAQFARTFRHPERGVVTLDSTLALYAWHGRHHAAHVTALRERKRW
jgi:uncharacterized damage-inducible protein DinB